MPVHNANIPKVIKTAIHTPIYDELRELRKTATHKEMAKAFDTNPTTINNILNGEIEKVSLDKLIPIADKMGIEMSIVTSQAGEETVTKITK